MKKDIPEIEDLITGINDPDVTLGTTPRTSEEESPLVISSHIPSGGSASVSDCSKCWQDFLSLLETDELTTDKNDRLVCKLDRDLADSLDDCDIHNHSRSVLVNAIVRAFFTTYLGKLAKYRREKKSLFVNFKEKYDGNN